MMMVRSVKLTNLKTKGNIEIVEFFAPVIV